MTVTAYYIYESGKIISKPIQLTSAALHALTHVPALNPSLYETSWKLAQGKSKGAFMGIIYKHTFHSV